MCRWQSLAQLYSEPNVNVLQESLLTCTISASNLLPTKKTEWHICIVVHYGPIMVQGCGSNSIINTVSFPPSTQMGLDLLHVHLKPLKLLKRQSSLDVLPMFKEWVKSYPVFSRHFCMHYSLLAMAFHYSLDYLCHKKYK